MRIGMFAGPHVFDYRSSNENPYGALLVEALQKRGLTVERLQYQARDDDAHVVDAGWLWRNRGRFQALHLQWIFGVYLADSALLAWLRLIRFAARLALARLLGYRVVWTLHNLLPHERPYRGIDVASRLFMAVLASAIICHCEFARRAFARRFARRRQVYAIPHGNFIAPYPNEISRDQARARLAIPPDAFVYVALGIIRHYKGYDDLCEAFRRLPGDHLRLVIAGYVHHSFDVGIGRECERDERVRWIEGTVPNAEMQIYMNAADVGMFPYRDALTSGAVINALGFAKPIIATRLGCIPEVLGDSGAGEMVPPGDVDALAAAMREAQTWDLAARGAAAQRRARELDWDSIAGRTLVAYGVT